MIQQSHGRIRFGSLAGLPEADRTQLADALTTEAPRSHQPLDGRGGNHIVETPELGAVFIKHYLRGGWLRHLNERSHLWNPRSRSRREFENLVRVREVGVSAPVPIGWAERGTVMVNCWLLMRVLPETTPLSRLLRDDSPLVAKALPTVAAQVARLIHSKLHHVDFHPGNVLVGEDGTVHLIDFDKARLSAAPTQQLTEYYIQRWNRAIVKHGLPQAAAHGFSALLLDVIASQPS